MIKIKEITIGEKVKWWQWVIIIAVIIIACKSNPNALNTFLKLMQKISIEKAEKNFLHQL